MAAAPFQAIVKLESPMLTEKNDMGKYAIRGDVGTGSGLSVFKDMSMSAIGNDLNQTTTLERPNANDFIATSPIR